MSEGLSIRAYAEHRKALGLRGQTPQSVSKALKSGRIKKNKHGKIDPADADASWASNSDPTRGQDLSEISPAPPAAPARRVQPVQPPSGKVEHLGDDEEGPLDLAQERARLAKASADLKRRELELLEGSIIKIEDARSILVSMIASAKERLLGIGAELAPELCGLAGGDSARAAAVADRIEAATIQALEELRDNAFDRE